MKKRRRGCGCATFIIMIILLGAAALWALNNKDKIEQLFYPLDYEGIVAERCEEYGVDKWLAMALIREESGFKQDAVSNAGAYGLMQLMPDTASWLIERGGFDISVDQAIYDAESNITIGVYYLSVLKDVYLGKVRGTAEAAMIAAYNAGIGSVDSWLEEGVWDGSTETLADIPYDETRAHVSNVLKSRDAYQRLYE
ncbi:MAG: lytic transglycosylase domain-containing protein [Firmicutes bacterium]|nr:lytic transglycosylase domain-containing protein [Bacillota bacterium]